MVKGAPDYAGVAKQVMRADIYEEAMKEIGVAPGDAEPTKPRCSTAPLRSADPEEYARSFPVNSLAELRGHS